MTEIDNEIEFLNLLSARCRQYADGVKRREITKTFASFELIKSIFSAFEGGIDGDKISKSYPVAAWREDRVEIPRALLRPIVQAWMTYVDAKRNLTMGEAFGLEGGGSGKRPAKALQGKIDRDRRLSNLAIVDYISSKMEGSPVSQDAAFLAVADAEGVSYETVRKAYQKHSPDTLKELKKLGVIIS